MKTTNENSPMETTNEAPNEKKPNKMSYIFGLFMVLIYLGMGYLLMFTSLFEEAFPELRYYIGGFFVIYGIFRAYRQIKWNR